MEINQQDDEINFSKNARRWESSEEEDEAEDLDEDDIERRRMVARQKAVIKQQEEVYENILLYNQFNANYCSVVGAVGKRRRERK